MRCTKQAGATGPPCPPVRYGGRLSAAQVSQSARRAVWDLTNTNTALSPFPPFPLPAPCIKSAAFCPHLAVPTCMGNLKVETARRTRTQSRQPSGRLDQDEQNRRHSRVDDCSPGLERCGTPRGVAASPGKTSKRRIGPETGTDCKMAAGHNPRQVCAPSPPTRKFEVPQSRGNARQNADFVM